MEPFALFHLLQSLLSPPVSNETDTQIEKNAPPSPQTETDPSTTPTPTEESPKTDAQDAFLRFVSAHEARAKRTKKNN